MKSMLPSIMVSHEQCRQILPVNLQENRLSSFFKMILLTLLAWNLSSPSVFGQTPIPADPCPNCTAEDIKVVQVFINGYDSTVCRDSGIAIAGATLRMRLDVTARQRYGLLFVGNLFVNGVFKGVIDTCYERTYEQGFADETLPLPSGVTITAGATIEIRNVLTAWDNNKPKNGVFTVCSGYTNGNFDCKAFGGTGLTPKCKYYASFTVVTNAKPSISEISKVNITCSGGSNGAINIKVSPANQTPYVYAWTKTGGGFSATTQNVTGLTAGTYQVIVTHKLCSDTAVFTLSEPPLLTASITAQTNVLCFGNTNGSATVTAGGGTPGYTYSWNTTPAQTTATATGLGAGQYIVTVKDASLCEAKDTVIITQPAKLTADINTQTNVLCFGNTTGSATVTAGGGTPSYTYSWNTTPTQTTATATGLAAGQYIVTVKDANNCEAKDTVIITQPAKLMVDVTSQTNVLCFGNATGSATATPSGGKSPYSYSWNTTPTQTVATATGLGAGQYIVTVTDSNSCTAKDTVIITEPSKLNVDITAQTNVLCFGNTTGTATATPSGGKTPYSYSWNTTPTQTVATATGLGAGQYIVTVTDSNSCTAKDTVVITQPTKLIADITSQTNILCNGNSTGSATVSPSGGKTPYTYSWNTTPPQTTATATGLGAGQYIVTVTDSNSCTAKDTVVITQPSTLAVTITTQTNVLCFGNATGSATAIPSGGKSPYSYSWNTTPAQTTATATGLAAGQYIVTVTDSNICTAKDTVVITQPTKLIADITSQVNVLCNGNATGSATVTPSGGISPYSYSWNTTPAQTTATATGLAAGQYIVTVTDSNSCTAKDTVVITEASTLIVDINAQTNVLCFGNSTGSATANVSGGLSPYSYSWNTTPAQTTATATGLAAGQYIVTVTDSNSCTAKDTVVITQPTKLNADITSQTNVLCNGDSTGTAMVMASGGKTPYSYSWNTNPVKTTATATGLAAGQYIVTVTDSNSCTAKDTVQISEPTAILVSTVANDSLICNGSTTTITVTASGGVGTLQFKVDMGNYQAGNTFSVGTGEHVIYVKDTNDCIETDTITINGKECNRFCTYTQGYFGTDNRGKASYDQGDGCIQTETRTTIQHSLEWWDDHGGMQIGNITADKIKVDSILAYLPGGGPSVQYSGQSLTAAPSNTLLSQTLALGLNIGLNEYLAGYVFGSTIASQQTNGECGQGDVIHGTCQSYPLDTPYSTMTVLEIFEAAGNALASGTDDQRRTLAGIAGAINELFDECAKAVSDCPSPITSARSSNNAMSEWSGVSIPSKLEVKAYPNPFRNIVYLRFKSPVSGDALIELYDMTGRKLEVQYRRNVLAGYDHLVEFNAQKHSYSLLYYRIQVGKYSENGKLVNARK